MTDDDSVHHHTEKYFGSLLGAISIATLFHICSLYTAYPRILIILTHGALSLFIAYRLVKAQSTWQASTIIGGLGGALSAVIVGIYTLIVWFSFLAVFKLITQTVFTGILDSVATGLFFLLIQLIKSKVDTRPYDSSNQTH